MVVRKEDDDFDTSKHRWVDDNEIIIEDLPEEKLFEIAESMASQGYNIDYWKAPKQKSGHLHIRDIIFPSEPELSNLQLRLYKKKVMMKYVPSDLWSKVDWNFVKTKRHRVALENEEHFKGYGVKSFVKGWNEDKKNYAEKELYDYVVSHSSSRNLKAEVMSIPSSSSIIKLMTYQDFEDFEDKREFLVSGLIEEGTLNMIYSPPKKFKSFITLSMALCIAQGRSWMGFDTKKSPVLYLDKENSLFVLKDRMKKLYKGFGFSRKNFPFFVSRNGVFMDMKRRIQQDFIAEVERVVKEQGVKLIVLDTLHRFAHYDENSADDINLLYSEVLRPLMEGYGVAIIFLHHSTKKGKYRGSGDFEGMVDSSFRVDRVGKTDSFKIVNEAGRSGEADDIYGEIDFGDDYINLISISRNVDEEKSKLSKLKEVTEMVKSLFNDNPTAELGLKDISSKLEMMDYEHSLSTLKRSLSWLVEDAEFLVKRKGKHFLNTERSSYG